MKYGYSKQVLVDQKGAALVQSKIYSTTCGKLKYNDSRDRQSECGLATGYFLVNQANLFKEETEVKDLQGI